MDCSNKAADELLTFSPSPDLNAKNFVDHAIYNTVLQGFDFDKFLAEEPGTLGQVAELYSEDPTLSDIQQQPVYNDNVPSNQTAASVSFELTRTMVSSDVPTSSFQPAVQPESFVNLACISLSSLPSTNCGLDLYDPEDDGFYPYEQELQEEFDQEYPQSPEQVRLEQQSLGQVTLEQVRAQQARPNYIDLVAVYHEALEEQTQVVRRANQPSPEVPLIPAAFPQEFRQEINQPNKPRSDKVLKHLAIAKNKRSANIANFDPTQHYQPLPQPPQGWGGMSAHTRQPTFQYNAQGELKLVKFSIGEINEYLSTHPLHNDFTVNRNKPAAKTSGLILWVQICPADSNKRYGDPNASKCRFENCPMPNNTIQKGQYRIAFDEQWCKQGNSDPFHNAGYVHLFCFEKYFDFPGICKTMNIKADTRELPHEPDKKNKMAITRDSPSMEKVVNDYIENPVPWENPRSSDYYKNTLCYALTLNHLERQSRTRKSKRQERGGNNVDVHLNNLDVLAENLNRRKQGQPFIVYEMPTPNAERHQSRKRKSRDEEGEAKSPGPPSKKLRATKQPSQIAAKPKSPTKRPQRPQTLKLTSRHVEGESRKPKSPIKRPELLERSQDDYYTTNESASPVKRPVLKRKSEDELAPPVKRPKVPKKPRQISQHDEEYDADESCSSTPPIGKYSVPRRKSPGLKEEVRRPDLPVQRPQTKKRKSRELKDGERSPAEIFRQLLMSQ